MTSSEFEGRGKIDYARRLEVLSARFKNKSAQVMQRANMLWSEMGEAIANRQVTTGDLVRDAVLVHYGRQSQEEEDSRTAFFNELLELIKQSPDTAIAIVSRHVKWGSIDSLELGILNPLHPEPRVGFAKDPVRARVTFRCRLLLRRTDMRVGYPNIEVIRPPVLNVMRKGETTYLNRSVGEPGLKGVENLILIGSGQILSWRGPYGADEGEGAYKIKGGLPDMFNEATKAIRSS